MYKDEVLGNVSLECLSTRSHASNGDHVRMCVKVFEVQSHPGFVNSGVNKLLMWGAMFIHPDDVSIRVVLSSKNTKYEYDF